MNMEEGGRAGDSQARLGKLEDVAPLVLWGVSLQLAPLRAVMYLILPFPAVKSS
jgi:hypothetical protein